jgi:predicted nucleic acid-binding protein
MIYFDTTFLLRLYLDETGFERIRELALVSELISSSVLAKSETVAAMHRHLREHKISPQALQEACRQFQRDQDDGLYTWFPLSLDLLEVVNRTFSNLPANIFLRAGDAIHLATASEAGFKEIHSNDKHLLAAAPIFKLKGVNPLAK